jgi:hypothetical protein
VRDGLGDCYAGRCQELQREIIAMPSLKLPTSGGGPQTVTWEDVRSVVIIGANGSGKSRLGWWIEENLKSSAVHRIAAHRFLLVPDDADPKAYERAEWDLYYGAYEPKAIISPATAAVFKKGRRWPGDPIGDPLDDFRHLLALLFADEAKCAIEYRRAARDAPPSNPAPPCRLDKLREIWSTVMPQRTLVMDDNRIEGRGSDGGPYRGKLLSDGERGVFYLIGQSLCAPADAALIIDEPEMHLHKAIQARLWDQIEAARPDCTFIYITHDLDFAATRRDAKRIWVRSFDGKAWEWEELPPQANVPDALLYEVLGGRRPLLFVEGEADSYDTAICTALYPKELVVPRQSCEKVVESTKAMRGLAVLHNLSIRGLVDRDRRSDDEIDALRTAGVLVADVAEVENLLCLPEALEAVAKHLKAEDVAEARAAAEGAVIAEMQKAIEHQALARALAEIQFRLNGFGPKIGKSDAAKLETDLRAYVGSIDVLATVARCRTLFDEAVATNDYLAALRLYNCKGIISFVAASLGTNSTAQMLVCGLLEGCDSDKLRTWVSHWQVAHVSQIRWVRSRQRPKTRPALYC